MNKMKIIVAHPGTQHSKRLAAAVEKSGNLECYCTMVYDSKKSLLMKFAKRVMGKKDLDKASRRKSEEIPDDKVKQFCELRGLLQLLIYRLDKNRKIYTPYSAWIKKQFGIKVAKYAIKCHADAVIMYDCTAFECFEYLKKYAPNILRIMDNAQTPRYYLNEVYNMYKDKCGEFWKCFENNRFLNDKPYCDRFIKETQLAQYHIVASSFSKKAVLKGGIDEKNIFVVPYGVEGVKFNKAKRNRTDDVLRFLFVGEVNQRKGIQEILKVAKKISNPKIEFHIVGYGSELHRELYTPYKSYVTFHGPLFADELENIYANSDVFLFPVMGEGFGLVVLEALSSGLPVICSENCVGRDVIKEGENGFVIPPCDANILLDRIMWFWKNKDKLGEMSNNAINTASQYTWDKYNSSINQALKAISEKEYEGQ